MTDESIGPLLRRLRVASGRSQDAQAAVLSDLSGRAVTRHELSRWERERRLLTPYWQAHVAVSFGIQVSMLRRAVATARIRRRRGAAWQPGSRMPTAASHLADRSELDIPSAMSLDEASTMTASAHRWYQAARYQDVATALPSLQAAARELAAGCASDDRRESLRLLTSVEALSAKLATKVGHGSAAWDAANRALHPARLAEDPHAQAAAADQAACAAFQTGRHEIAEEMATSAAAEVRGLTPGSVTWRGTLILVAAIIAARRRDRQQAQDRLEHADRLAAQLGVDGNIGWTAFGPTNVKIHRMSACVELDDPREALAIADRLESAGLTDQLRGRQAQIRLDSAWANVRLGEDPLALINLLEAERIAPELVHSRPYRP